MNAITHEGKHPEMVRCNYCQKDYGYYEKTGHKHVFKCLYCGIDYSDGKETKARAVIQVTYISGETRYVVVREDYPQDVLSDAIYPHRREIRTAIIRENTPMGTIERTVYRASPLSLFFAWLAGVYDRIECFVYNYLKWRLNNGKSKIKKTGAPACPPN